jgi:pyruvate dehydrogenase E2 component (dihydrolipoamide acetyltransferase)
MARLNDLLMPKLGLTMTEGLLAEWRVGPGDTVKTDDVIFVVETDKVANEITAQADGKIREIVAQAGETVPVGAVVARWTGPGQGGAEEIVQNDPARAEPAAEVVAAEFAETTKPSIGVSARVVATPLARRLARENDVDLQALAGSGPRGRIKAADVLAALEQPRAAAATHQARPAALPAAERQPASNIVQVMARRMVEAKQSVPHFYLAAEAEVSELLVLRERLNAQTQAPKLTLNHFVVTAVSRALEVLPQQNRIWHEGEIIQFHSVDIGVAVSSERGLLAPVVHDLGGRPLDEIAARTNAVIGRAREGKASREDMQGGAITISNAGMFNVTYMTPIINPPQSAILGVGSIREVFRPDANGAPTLKREMGLVLAGDHRLHDGASGLQFLNRVIALLQDPYLLLRSTAFYKG